MHTSTCLLPHHFLIFELHLFLPLVRIICSYTGHSTLFICNMNLANSDQNESTGAAEDPHSLKFTLWFEGMEDGCGYTIEEWIPKEGNKRTELEELRTPIKESDVSEWLKKLPQSTNLDGGLRLLVVENPTESHPGFPMKEDT